jgi:molybdopterin-containing oxidoreductase family iron-sulfur binding subunit
LRSRPNTAAELAALAERIRLGYVKALFVHGVDPLSGLPAAYGFDQALGCLERLISFASTPDATAKLADAILPDHAPSESWGYQVLPEEADWEAVSAIQPGSAPQYDTRAAADVLLEAARSVSAPGALPGFENEADFLRSSLAGLSRRDGVYPTSDPQVFWQLWKEHGGWRRAQRVRLPATPGIHSGRAIDLEPPHYAERLNDDRLSLLVYRRLEYDRGDDIPAPGAELHPPSAELHPRTAARLGLDEGALLRVITASGELRLPLILNPGLHPGALAIPWAGADSLPGLLGMEQNASGSLVFAGIPVRVELAG